MNNHNNRPILSKGEEYIVRHELGNSFPPKDKRPTFDEARIRLSGQVNSIIRNIETSSKEFLLDDVVINLRMRTDYSAKSYHPDDFISSIEGEDVGSKKWTKTEVDKKGKEKTKIGKEVFIKVKKNSLQALEQKLIHSSGFTKGSIENIRSIEDMYFDDHQDLENKFPVDWEKGRVEFVLHPFGTNTEESVGNFFALLNKYGADLNKVKYKTYESGISFFSVLLNRETLHNVINYNPIRTARPMNVGNLPNIRNGGMDLILPSPPTDKIPSAVSIGMFDGGIDATNPFLQGYVTEYNPISTAKISEGLMHGTGVTGAILYGELSSYSQNDTLPTPSVNVESFRVLPTTDPNDIDLYEVIDIIEDVVPKHPNIKVYNLSVGPYGAIEDDDISRFTYALDELSKNGDVLFIIAVGNDGHLPDDELCRIQAPADAVNCIGVGAYVPTREGNIERADYSSYGDGREGCKIKPDFLEFGGDSNRPFQLIPFSGNQKHLSAGTSFASPLVAAKAGEIIGRSGTINPLIARALLVHSAKHPNGKADKYMGHGILSTNADEILLCEDNQVLTIYEHRIQPTQAVKVPLPFLNELNYSGKAVVEWTIAVATPTKSQQSEDYTLCCVEDTFYPNENKYTLDNFNKTKIHSVDIINDIEKIENLVNDGWTLRKTPNTYSNFSNKYKTEQERKDNFKWDTIIKRRASMKYSSLNNPYLTLHAMERGNSKVDFVNFVVIVSVTYPTCNENVHELTLKAFNKLQEISIRTRNELLVR